MCTPTRDNWGGRARGGAIRRCRGYRSLRDVPAPWRCLPASARGAVCTSQESDGPRYPTVRRAPRAGLPGCPRSRDVDGHDICERRRVVNGRGARSHMGQPVRHATLLSASLLGCPEESRPLARGARAARVPAASAPMGSLRPVASPRGPRVPCGPSASRPPPTIPRAAESKGARHLRRVHQQKMPISHRQRDVPAGGALPSQEATRESPPTVLPHPYKHVRTKTFGECLQPSPAQMSSRAGSRL